MANAMKQTPQSYTLLHVQCDFLRSKGENAWALKLARQAVNCAPSEFVTWEKLTQIYIDLKMYDSVCVLIPRIEDRADKISGTAHAQLVSNVHL